MNHSYMKKPIQCKNPKDYKGFANRFIFKTIQYKKINQIVLYYYNCGEIFSGAMVNYILENADNLLWPDGLNLDSLQEVTAYCDYYMSVESNNCRSIKLYKYGLKRFDFSKVIMERDLKWAVLNMKHEHRNYRWLSQLIMDCEYTVITPQHQTLIVDQ